MDLEPMTRVRTIPKTVFQGEVTPVSLPALDNEDSALLSVVPRSGASRTPVILALTRMASSWTGMLTLPKTAQLGWWDWQIWADDDQGAPRHRAAGSFHLGPTFDSLDAIEETPAEAKLRQVEKAIEEMIASGTQSYTLSGDTTTMLSLGQLRRERLYLRDLVNRERRAKGLPYLEGTLPKHITYFADY